MNTDTAHILFASRSLPLHALGGMEMISWDLARQFVKDGLLVTFLTTEIPGKPERFMLDGVNVVALKGTRPGRYSRQWWKKSRDYFEKSLASNVSIVFSVSAAAYSLMHSAHAIPVILQAHGTSIGEIKSKWKTLSLKAILASLRNIYWLGKDLFYYAKFREIVAIGDAVVKDLQQFPISLVLPPGKVHLICNGVDHQLFLPDEHQRKQMRQSLGFLPETKILISVSRLHRQKGVDSALKAFAEYAKRNPMAHYLILGSGPERLLLERLAKQLKVDQQVSFLGVVPRNQLNQYLAVADVFLFTTKRREGLPLNILEALAAGLPVILSKQLENTLDTKEGIYAVDPDDVLAVANVIDQVLMNIAAVRNSWLPERFTLQFCAKKYYEIFKR